MADPASTRKDRIEKRGTEFFILSEEGEELEGPFQSEQDASDRLREIEAAKAARSKDGAEEPADAAKTKDSTDVARAAPDSAVPRSSTAGARRFDYLDLHVDPKRSDGVLMTEDPTTGFLRADARPSRIGVLEYQDADGNRWGELRTPEEVFSEDSLRSFDLAVVTDDHPADFVHASNVKDVQVGHVGSDARRDGRFVRVSLVVTDADTIQAIRDGKRELSCGYTAQVIADSGMADGLPFAARQTNIRINHIAIVDKGRAGAECSVLARGDAFHIITSEVHVDTKTITIGDKEHEVPAEVADAWEARQDDDTATLRARIDVLEEQAKANEQAFADRVDARSNLIAAARSLGLETTGKCDADLMREVVLKEMPTMEAKLDANKGDQGYLRACYDQALEMRGRRDRAEHDANTVLFDALNGGDGDPLLDALTSYAKRGAS